jgi:hypothetical protein
MALPSRRSRTPTKLPLPSCFFFFLPPLRCICPAKNRAGGGAAGDIRHWPMASNGKPQVDTACRKQEKKVPSTVGFDDASESQRDPSLWWLATPNWQIFSLLWNDLLQGNPGSRLVGPVPHSPHRCHGIVLIDLAGHSRGTHLRRPGEISSPISDPLPCPTLPRTWLRTFLHLRNQFKRPCRVFRF